jgi:hypothetical protein
MEKAELRKEWERRISVFRASGQTQAKWCATNDLKEHQLKYWLKRIEGSNSKQKSKAQWASVSIEEVVEEPNDTLQIKIGEASIEVKPGFNPSFLADVVRTLKNLC